MTTYQPRTPHSDPIKRPDCSKCGTLTRLFGIEPPKPGFELLSFSERARRTKQPRATND
jgi:hypothetical protein